MKEKTRVNPTTSSSFLLILVLLVSLLARSGGAFGVERDNELVITNGYGLLERRKLQGFIDREAMFRSNG